jgi:hypothetical protein
MHTLNVVRLHNRRLLHPDVMVWGVHKRCHQESHVDPW